MNYKSFITTYKNNNQPITQNYHEQHNANLQRQANK